MRIATSSVVLLAASGTAQEWWDHPKPPIERPSELEVDSAIELGVQWLLAQQHNDGTWPGFENDFPMGLTALVTLTLLKSDIQPEHDSVRKALDYLMALPYRKTYSASCLLQVLEALHRKEPPVLRKAEEGAAFLIQSQRKDQQGLWAYPDGTADLSNTQYALLGLRAAHLLGVKVPPEAFTDVCDRLVKIQADDGGFSYRKGELSRGSMTCAALAIFTMTEQIASASPAYRKSHLAYARARERALQWQIEHFTVYYNPEGPRGAATKIFLGYYLYSIERFCDFEGLTRLGDRDWYGEGARYLLLNQLDRGQWGSETDTCFALLFLQRASLTGGRRQAEVALSERRKALADAESERRARPRPDASIPFVTEWLVLGPIRIKDGLALDPEMFPMPSGRPVASGHHLGEKWEIHRSSEPTGFVDFEKALRPADRVAAYAATTVFAPDEMDAILWFSADDSWRVALDGTIVGELLWHGGAAPDRHALPIHLPKGPSTLVVQVLDLVGAFGFYARISDSKGRPIPGLRTGLRAGR